MEPDQELNNKYTEINRCRISGSTNLIPVLSLGEQYLTGVFPKSKEEKITKGPLDLVWCPDSGLLQLKQSYNMVEMYGENYGYRSGLNASMVNHLADKIHMLEKITNLKEDDLVIDIGSNDATSLKSYTVNCFKVGIDPVGEKFRNYYPENITLISDFFSVDILKMNNINQKAKIITSIAMFYDLENPALFVADIESVLSEDGIWHFEQSYMPSMLRMNAYDTVCHEHLEFYSFKVVKDLLEKHRLKILDVQMNAVNGGSFAVTACKANSRLKTNLPVINWMLRQEEYWGLDNPRVYRDFEERVYKHRNNLYGLVDTLTNDGKRIMGYGASTKGNVILQFCGFSEKHIPCIAEVNEDKIGAFTPGTNIPIISEEDAKAMKPDYFLVLPWHFKHSILAREQEFIKGGGRFIFPLPEIEIF